MPCDQIQEVDVAWTEATDLSALGLALEALGYGLATVEGKVLRCGPITYRAGDTVISFPWNKQTSPEVLKRAYTKATVLQNADRFGWAVKAKDKALALAGFTRKW